MLDKTVFVAASTSTAGASTLGEVAPAELAAPSPVEAGRVEPAVSQAAAAALVEPAALQSAERLEEAGSAPRAGQGHAANKGKGRWKWARGQYMWIAGRWLCVLVGFHHWIPSRWIAHGRDTHWVDGRWIA